jgi:2-octaprenylphenol hydroxylase
MSRKVDIVICGGGLVGLMFANLLAQSRFHLVVLDAGAAPTSVKLESPVQSGADLESGYEPRVSALNAGSMALLERCGVFSELGRHACFREMLVRDSEGAGDICFSSEDLGLPNLGMVIENHLVIEALHSRLVQFDNVDLCYGESFADVTKDDVLEVELSSGDILQCDLLVGADGGNSKVRELSGLKTVGWSYDQTAVVTTIQTEQSHDSIPRQWFTADGPLAFLPLADANLCSIVWSHRDASSITELDSESFCARLSEASEGELGRVIGADKRFSFPLKQQHAYRYVRSGIALIGDAAHTIHPLAGQGANLGIADAEALAMEIRQAVFSDERPGDLKLLRRFALARQPHNLAIATAMETLKRLYGSKIPAIGWLRNQSMRFLNQNSALRSLVMQLASGQNR